MRSPNGTEGTLAFWKWHCWSCLSQTLSADPSLEVILSPQYPPTTYLFGAIWGASDSLPRSDCGLCALSFFTSVCLAETGHNYMNGDAEGPRYAQDGNAKHRNLKYTHICLVKVPTWSGLHVKMNGHSMSFICLTQYGSNSGSHNRYKSRTPPPIRFRCSLRIDGFSYTIDRTGGRDSPCKTVVHHMSTVPV